MRNDSPSCSYRLAIVSRSRVVLVQHHISASAKMLCSSSMGLFISTSTSGVRYSLSHRTLNGTRHIDEPQTTLRSGNRIPTRLDLATQKLGDLGTRRSREERKETVDLQLQLGHGITRDGLINDQINTSGIPDVLGADERICRHFREVHAGGTSGAFRTIRVAHSEPRVAISSRENACVRQITRPRKGQSDGIDGNCLRIGESHETEPMQKLNKDNVLFKVPVQQNCRHRYFVLLPRNLGRAAAWKFQGPL